MSSQTLFFNLDIKTGEHHVLRMRVTKTVSDLEGMTATPTAAVVLALFAQVTMIQLAIDGQQMEQIYGVQPHHLLLCDALGLDHAWYEAPLAHKIAQFNQAP